FMEREPPNPWTQPQQRMDVEVWMSQPRGGDPAPVEMNPVQVDDTWRWEEMIMGSVLLAWPGGAIVILASTLFRNWRFTRRVKLAPICSDDRVLERWQKCLARAKVRRAIPIVVFDGVEQPAVMGAWRPKLLLPAELQQLDDQQLEMIMLHELAHVRRRDVAV